MPRKSKKSAESSPSAAPLAPPEIAQPELAPPEKAAPEIALPEPQAPALPETPAAKPKPKLQSKPKPKPKPKKRAGKTASAPAATEAPPKTNPAAIPAVPAPKPARKKRAKKAAPKAEPELAAEAAALAAEKPGEAEAEAQVADTFESAIEPNSAAESARTSFKTASAAPQAKPEQAQHEKSAPRPQPKLERLQKILARAGVASRRHAEELITEGRVQVNGKIVTELGSRADAASDHIRVDGKLLHGAERLRYFVLNKPRSYVTTVSDPEKRPTVMDFFAKFPERLYPVGRLDFQSEGLLLVTNDGELANRLTQASSGVEKTYLVKVAGQPSEESIARLREGVRIDRGRPGPGSPRTGPRPWGGEPGSEGQRRVRTAPAQIRLIRPGENPWYEVAIIEGRNRELRKMFEEIGHHVEKVRRVGYGPLVLDLEPGNMRELDEQELKSLRLAAEGKWKPRRANFATMLPKEAGRTAGPEAPRRGARPIRTAPPRREALRTERPFNRDRDQRPPRQQDRPQPRFDRVSDQRPPQKRPGRSEPIFDRRPPQGSLSQRPQRSAPGAQGFRRPPARPFDRGGPRGPRPEGSGDARPSSARPGGARELPPRDRPARFQRPDRPPFKERGEYRARPSRSEGPGRSDRPVRTDRPTRTDRPYRSERPAPGDRPARGEFRAPPEPGPRRDFDRPPSPRPFRAPRPADESRPPRERPQLTGRQQPPNPFGKPPAKRFDKPAGKTWHKSASRGSSPTRFSGRSEGRPSPGGPRPFSKRRSGPPRGGKPR